MNRSVVVGLVGLLVLMLAACAPSTTSTPIGATEEHVEFPQFTSPAPLNPGWSQLSTNCGELSAQTCSPAIDGTRYPSGATVTMRWVEAGFHLCGDCSPDPLVHTCMRILDQTTAQVVPGSEQCVDITSGAELPEQVLTVSLPRRIDLRLAPEFEYSSDLSSACDPNVCFEYGSVETEPDWVIQW